MAKAPSPKQTRRAKEDRPPAGSQLLTISISRPIETSGKRPRILPESHTIAVDLVSVKEDSICRASTGRPFEEWVTAFSSQSLRVIWWMARRAQGETFLTFARAEEEWPSDLDLEEEVDVELDDGEDDDGEDLSDPEG